MTVGGTRPRPIFRTLFEADTISRSLFDVLVFVALSGGAEERDGHGLQRAPELSPR